jgi:predicted amidophosphoribosyltransferase
MADLSQPCPVCGQPRVAGGCANRWCRRPDRAFSWAYAVGPYQGRLRDAILDYKYRDGRWRAGGFARLLSGYLNSHPTWFEEFDLIVGVPSYTGPGARRVWDPVRLILDRLADVQGARWPVAAGAVAKTAETPALSGLPVSERLRVAARQLGPRLQVAQPRVVAGARIIVVDDVFTDGSTLHEVARVLLRAGASEVAGLVIARPAWHAHRQG